VRETTALGDARRLAAAADAAAFDAVIATGGDGTVNEAVNGLAEGDTGLALGLIPLGTTNVLAGEVGLAARASEVASVLATAPPRPIYPGRVDGHLFLVMASVGLDARVVASVDLSLKRWLGKGAYAAAALAELMGRAPPPFTVRIGDREVRAASIVAAKGRRYAGPYVAAPAADLGRPDLEVCLLSGGGRWDVARQALALVRGRFSSLSDLEIVRAPMLEITGPEGQPVQADGDVIARLPVTIDVTPEPILLLAP
jgi:diacylglycerol kinase family enzyme